MHSPFRAAIVCTTGPEYANALSAGRGACACVKLAARAGYSRSAGSRRVSMGPTRRIGGAFAWNSSRSSEPRTTRSSWRPSRASDSRSPSTTCCASSFARRAETGTATNAGDSSEPARDPGAHPRRAVGGGGRDAARRARRGRRALRGPGARRARARRRAGARRAGAARRRPRGRRATRPSARPCAPSSPRPARPASAGPAGRSRRGWIVKLEFTASEVDHDARWGFEPRRSDALAAERRRDPALAPGVAARGSDPAAARPRPDAARRTTRASTAARSARAGCPTRADLESPERPVAGRARRAAGRDQARGRADRDVGRDRRPARGAAAPARPARAAARRRATFVVDPRRTRPVALFDALEPGYDEAPHPSRARAGLRAAASAVAEASAAARAARRCRRGTRSSSGPAARTDATPDAGPRQANAPRRMSGTVRSSSVSEPCWPTIFCGALSASRSS